MNTINVEIVGRVRDTATGYIIEIRREDRPDETQFVTTLLSPGRISEPGPQIDETEFVPVYSDGTGPIMMLKHIRPPINPSNREP